MPVLNEAEGCPHSAPTTKAQRYDFIQSGNYRIPSFVTLRNGKHRLWRAPSHDRLEGFGRK